MPSDTIILLTLTPLFSMSLMHPWGVQGRNPELRSPVNVVGDGDGNDDDVDDDDDDDIDDVCDEDDDDIYIMMQCLFVCHEKWALPPGSLL